LQKVWLRKWAAIIKLLPAIVTAISVSTRKDESETCGHQEEHALTAMLSISPDDSDAPDGRDQRGEDSMESLFQRGGNAPISPTRRARRE
jgi:hypothetical protein